MAKKYRVLPMRTFNSLLCRRVQIVSAQYQAICLGVLALHTLFDWMLDLCTDTITTLLLAMPLIQPHLVRGYTLLAVDVPIFAALTIPVCDPSR